MTHSKETRADVERLVSLDETRAALGDISRTTLWRLIRDGALSTVAIGSRRFVRATEISRFIEDNAGR